MMTPQEHGIKVVHKTLDVLEILKTSDAAIGLAELTRAVGLPKPTVFRIVTTLESRGYLDRDSEGRYRVARKLQETYRDASLEQRLIGAARPVMEKLVQFCKETVNLGVQDGGEVVVIATLESPQAVRMSSKVGNRRYLHSTALGKVLLGGMADKEILRLVRMKSLPRLTPKTITSESALFAEIARVRRLGYGGDNQENELDGRCIAGPITDASRTVVAALSISGPVHRMDTSHLRSLVPALRRSCETISKALGR